MSLCQPTQGVPPIFGNKYRVAAEADPWLAPSLSSGLWFGTGVKVKVEAEVRAEGGELGLGGRAEDYNESRKQRMGKAPGSQAPGHSFDSEFVVVF